MTGNDLRAIRERAGMTIKTLAEATGYSWSQIQRMEVGRRNVSRRIVLEIERLGLK